ncbi:MAG TPA: TonB-dependent receptor [Bacteroidales bacterium]|nr:TonB-dependent receptor [Bacteroidales bacterium]
MKKLPLYFFILFVLSIYNCISANAQITGTITDKNTKEPLVGATIYVPDLKVGTVSNLEGKYSLNNLPRTSVLLQINMIGYRTIIYVADLSTPLTKDFQLEYVATEINEVVITGSSAAMEQKRTPVPISVVSKTELLQNSSTNIIDVIALQPGINQISTGTAISKPVIRGLGYNRVITMHNGVRQEGQQWGDEHGIEIDEYTVGKVEILKGPASLAYGSDALAGVVNMLPAPLVTEGKIAGSLVANYQTNAGLLGYSLNLGGNQKGFVWDMRYSNKLSHSYQNKYDGYVYNSGFRENAVSALAGLNKRWGYSHLELSAYSIQPGIIEGERDSLTGRFIKLTGTGEELIATNADGRSYTPGLPFQKIHHYKAVWDNTLFVGSCNIKATLGFQQNQRQEYGENADEYGLYFLLNTLNYDFVYNLPSFSNFAVSAGVNGMKQTSENKGSEYLVPAYDLFDIGVFGIVKKSLGTVDISGGIRYDSRKQTGEDLFLDENGTRVDYSGPTISQRFRAFSTTFSSFSWSFGATWQISKTVYTKFNVSRGFRAPNISELGSNGVHEGTLRYETGDPALKPETSLQFDYTLGLNTEHISAELSLFHNSIDDFIFLRKLNNVQGVDSVIDGNTVFKFISGNARLYGGEFRFDIHPHPYDWLHFENMFSLVQAEQKSQPDSSRYLPFTPAARLLSTIKTDIPKLTRWLSNVYLKFTVDHSFAQNNVYSAYDTETATPQYTLLNAGVGTDIKVSGKTFCSLYISINNLADVAYQSHLSRLKYAPMNYATGRSGIYNMGRNVSFKLVVPIGIR